MMQAIVIFLTMWLQGITYNFSFDIFQETKKKTIHMNEINLKSLLRRKWLFVFNS